MKNVEDHRRQSEILPKITALSFFSGAMGLDIGMSNGGIKALLASEINNYCRMTIRKNNPDIGLIGDINKYSVEEILNFANIAKNHKIDVIFGGPPCQAFSTAGKQKGFDDERGNVFLKYLDIVSKIKPTYVVIENVRGLLSTKYDYFKNGELIKGGALLKILEKLNTSGYSVSFNLYNTANFGVPQIRERIVLIGKLGTKKVPHLCPTHSEDIKHNLPSWKTFGDAVNNLTFENKHNFIQFPEKRLRFYELLKDGQYWKNLPFDLQKEAMGKAFELAGGKTGFYRRLSFSKPSPTLVTNPIMPATDLCHPVENRPLSIEEYKCIQGFPESWEFCGSIREQYKQIGNAVPIKFGEAIAKTILADMNGETLPTIPNFKHSRYKNTDEVSWLKSIRKNFPEISLF